MPNSGSLPTSSAAPAEQKAGVLTWVAIASLVYIILLAVASIGSGFKWATGGEAKALFDLASNPFSGLLIGVLATALVQSSSTVTSIIVGLVAGGLPVQLAIPMIMGANIGTTITNTLVSLGHIGDKTEFKRAFAAATVHDFFNLMCVAIFLPIELSFHIFERSAGWLANHMVGGDSMSLKGFNFIKPITKPVISTLKDSLASIPEPWGGVALIFIGIFTILLAIGLLGRLLRVAMVGRARAMLHATIGRGAITGIISGAGITTLVQSSSTTTSLIVPLVGSGVFKMRDVYPFTLGANIGTTVTALLAATAVSGDTAIFALQIALVHLLYNVTGVVVIYGLPFTRELPPACARALAKVAAKNKSVAIMYVVSVFFLLPAAFIYLGK